MTQDTALWGWPDSAAPWRGAARALQAADDEVAAALRDFASADDVAWVATAATRYRAVLQADIDRLRAARSQVAGALAAAAAHDRAVEVARLAAQLRVAQQALGLGLPWPGLPPLPGAW
jgi:hypothetical protein